MKRLFSLLFALLIPSVTFADLTSFVASGLSGSSPTIKLGTTDYLTFSSSSNVLATMQWGDGSTADQDFRITARTADGADTGVLAICGGGAYSSSRGACFEVHGNEDGVAGDARIDGGDSGGSNVVIAYNQNAGNIHFYNETGTSMWTMDSSENLKQDTVGGQFLMANAGTASRGMVLGASAVPADVSAAIGQPLEYVFTTSNADHKALALFHGQANANPTKFIVGKSRAVDGSADTVVSNGDQIFGFEAYSADGASFQPAAAMYAEVDAASGSGDTPGRWTFYVTPDGTSSLAEALIIKNTQALLLRGALTSTANDLNWKIVDQTDNQACTTGCTNACVAGQDLAGANKPLVSCDDTTADICLCAGAS